MYVWFYVLTHSKYRFLFHAVYSGIMNGTRKPTFHDARYDRLKDLDSDDRSRPLQSVRRTFFRRPTVVILHKGKTRPRKPFREILKTSDRDSPARIFPIARWERAVPLSDKLAFVRQRCSLCEAGAFSRVERLSNPKLWILTKKEHSSPKLRVTSILSASMKSRISASTSCFVRPDWSITAAGLLLKESSARSS